MKKALVVGLNSYPHGGELFACVNDATEISKRLERNGDGSKNFDVVTITDKCSRALLKTKIDECFADNADIALFYFAGHGYIDSFGGKIIATDNDNADISLRDILGVVYSNNIKTVTQGIVEIAIF